MSDKLELSNKAELFMSFGMLNALTKIIKGPEVIGALDLDPEIRDQVLGQIFAKRKPSGKLLELADPEDLDLSLKDIEATLDWAKEHIMSFFLRRLESLASLLEDKQNQMKTVESSLSGLKETAL